MWGTLSIRPLTEPELLNKVGQCGVLGRHSASPSGVFKPFDTCAVIFSCLWGGSSS